jgi:hypothetical protein
MPSSTALNRRPELSDSLLFLGTADLRETAGSLADREAEGADGILLTYTPIQHQTEVAVEDMCDCAVRKGKPPSSLIETQMWRLKRTPGHEWWKTPNKELKQILFRYVIMLFKMI